MANIRAYMLQIADIVEELANDLGNEYAEKIEILESKIASLEEELEQKTDLLDRYVAEADSEEE
jgi:hypothetical protein